MDKKEIISVAMEAGFMLSTMHGQESPKLMPVSDSETLLAFAKLIAAAERERCAKVVLEEGSRQRKIGRQFACIDAATAVRSLE